MVAACPLCRKTALALLAVLAAGAALGPRNACCEEDAAAPAAVQRGTVEFVPLEAQRELPARFRLAPHRFPYELEPLETVSRKIEVYRLRFPSPVKTRWPQNNTVVCEYYRPRGKGPYPAVVGLHILGGDFDLLRLFCRTLAHNGVCALFLVLPHYGPRYAPGGPRRAIGPDPHQSVRAMTQAVLDIRRAGAWLAQRPEVDPRRLGVFGISLGGITAALASAMEPRLHNALLLLAGGDLRQLNWQSPELAPVRRRIAQQGLSLQEVLRIMQAVDPAYHAERLRRRRVLMINGRYDQLIPPACTKALWEAAGRPPIQWWDCGHYTAMRFVFVAVAETVQFFRNSQPRPDPR